MNNRDILNKAINVLQSSLDLSEAIHFNIEPYMAISKQRVPDSIFQIKVMIKSAEKYIGEKSVEVKLVDKIFITEVRKTVQPRFLRSGISYLKKINEKYPDWNPLIISSYIGPGGRELCRNEGISYIDTLGNLGIFLRNVFILKESKESPKRDRKELKFLFSPKSTRIIRAILENPAKRWRLQEIANTAGVSVGGTYNVVKKLADELYVEKTEKGVSLVNPSKLLEKWSSSYTITQINKIDSFYLSESVYKVLIKRLADVAEKGNYSYAFTLFAGVNFIIPYVHTPHVHLYLTGNVDKFIEEAKLKSVDSGGNVHIITPYDEGIFNPLQIIEGIKIVGKIQLYLDLFNYPARGEEQARVLRNKFIQF